MIVDSDKVVYRCLNKGLEVQKILGTRPFVEKLLRDFPDLQDHPLLFCGDKPVLESIVGHRLHHGVVGVFKRPEDAPKHSFGNRIVLFNGVNNAENVGAIIRSAHAFGFDTVICDQESCSPYVRRAVRVSMGSVFSLKVLHTDSIYQQLIDLKKSGYRIYGSAISPKAQSCRNIQPTDKFVLVLGSEGHGMSPEALELCDQVIRIPTVNHIDSLNVAVASGVLLYQLGGPET